MELIVIASPCELELVRNEFNRPNTRIIITGVGALNVYRALSDIPRDTKIINIGYVGSVDIPIGTRVEIERCELYHPGVNYEENGFFLSEKGVTCYTGVDFVQNSNYKGCVFDMELAFICAMGFDVRSIKYVSDNCNYEEYENTINNEN